MRLLRPSSEDEMILAFLRAEVHSPRFKPIARSHLGNDLALVGERANLEDATQNARRRAALGGYRGFDRDEYLFGGFPADVEWHLVALTRDDLAGLRYANSPEWVLLSGGSRLVQDGAEAIDRDDPMPDGETLAEIATANGWPEEELSSDVWAGKVRGNADGVRAVEGELAAGRTYPEIILIAGRDSEEIYVVEGHTRATALLRHLPDGGEVEAIAGYAPTLAGWSYL